MRWLALALATAVVASPNPVRAADQVGINAHVPAADVAELVADLGVHWVRVDNNWFQQGDPCGSSIQFIAPLDTAVSESVARGVNVYMTLAYTPACASLGDSDGVPNSDVPDPTKYANYVRQSVAHYRAMGVTHYGLWNEANLGHFFEGSAQQYVDNIVLPGIAAIADGCQDAGHSDCLALGPDLAHVGDYDVFLEDLLTRMGTAGAAFDIFTHHIYQDHDTPIYDGDSFLNALESRRFSFTRRSLIDVLTDTGNATNGTPAFEVWITETGYKAKPPTDAGEMATQSSHYMKTLDEQLARPWYTNTFFYEIVDSGDELDGYGIARRDGGGFLHKDAYTALQNRIATDPGFQDAPDSPDAGPGNGSPDAGPGSGGADAGPTDPPAGPDAGAGGGGGANDPNGSSGGCSTGGASYPAWPLLALFAIVAVRRTASAPR